MEHLRGAPSGPATPPANEGRYADALPREVRDDLAMYGYSTLLNKIRSQQIYADCAARNRVVRPTSAELEALRHSPDERHVLAGDTLLDLLRKPDGMWSTWDEDKGAALKTYFVGALIARFPRIFLKWQETRLSLPLPIGVDVAALSARAVEPDPALGVVTRDRLERALRSAEPEVRAVLGLVAAGYQHSEIADRLRLSERAVEGRIYRFRRSIRNPVRGTGTPGTS
ncbi:RNA polymerase sigma factor [Streptomyces sp. NPDC051218]|uniref:RNA polymerase sigma factor n=1 Tax=Streptomyces sp. NPDC051218 TaxID=3365645 RepID=UPI0037B5B8DB